MSFNLRALLEEMIEREASDLHITAGERPKLRIDGDITDSSVPDILTPKDTLQLAYSVLTENQKKRFETEDELDFSFGIQNLARFRGNCFKQRGRGDHRQDQKGAEGSHHHGGGPDRVDPPPPEGHRDPARDRHRHQELP